jgi:hypothetical protein
MAGSRRLLSALPLLWFVTLAPSAGAGSPHGVVVVNRAPHAIDELYISPVSNGEWGPDRLGDGSIAPGRSLRLRLDPDSGCSIDLQVVYDDASREERHDLDICRDAQVSLDGSRAVAPPEVAGGAHPVTIVNNAARPIQQVFVSATDAGDWGDDLLGENSLSVGDRTTLTYHGVCLADLRIVYDNRSAEERRNVDVCMLRGVVVQPGWTTADLLAPLPQPRSDAPGTVPVIVSVTNHAAHAARALFIYPEGSATRGANLLGAAPLDAGGQVAVGVARPPGACRFDAHVEYAAPRPSQDMRGLDLCRDTALSLPAFN